MRHKSLLTYGLLATAGYLLYKHMQTAAAPVVAVPAAPTGGVSGFGYFPSGADRPFARMTTPGAGLPFARYSHGVRWY